MKTSNKKPLPNFDTETGLSHDFKDSYSGLITALSQVAKDPETFRKQNQIGKEDYILKGQTVQTYTEIFSPQEYDYGPGPDEQELDALSIELRQMIFHQSLKFRKMMRIMDKMHRLTHADPLNVTIGYRIGKKDLHKGFWITERGNGEGEDLGMRIVSYAFNNHDGVAKQPRLEDLAFAIEEKYDRIQVLELNEPYVMAFTGRHKGSDKVYRFMGHRNILFPTDELYGAVKNQLEMIANKPAKLS